jgi:hypothetical protein
MRLHRLLLPLLAYFATQLAGHAQISVEIGLKQRLHILHEPVIATVTLTNRTGRDITLSDTPQYQWFGFRITTDGDRLIAPRSLKYHLDPLSLKAGETVKRSANLNQLYELGEFGTYRIQATVYYDGLDKFFSSKPTHIELTEGHVLWRQIAGVPEGQPGAGQMRVFTLLSNQRGESNMLYVRIEDKDDGTVFCTAPIGRLLEGVPPQAQFDAASNLYILQLVGVRSYILTKMTPNGELGGQTTYSAPKTRPTLRKTADGTLQIIGGKKEAAIAQNPSTPAEPPPKLSDRPPGFPGN